MKVFMAITLTASLMWLGGCNSPEWPTQRRSEMNAWSVNQYHRDSVRAAIVSQHTLYPYHFIANSADLNELGERDLAVLADHYRDNPGRMNVRQMGAPGALYQARIETVASALAGQGVDAERIRIADGQAGGAGISSERAVVILDEKMDAPFMLESTELSTISSE